MTRVNAEGPTAVISFEEQSLLQQHPATTPQLAVKSSDARLSKSTETICTVSSESRKTSSSSSDKTSRLGLVGIVTCSFDSAYHGRMVEQASKHLTEHGYDSVVISNARSKSGERNAISSLDKLDCDGLIIFSFSLDDEELAVILDSHPTAVLMNRYLPAYHDRCVYLDNTSGGRIAAQYLLEMGHTAIAMVTGPEEYLDVRERSNGFLSGLTFHTPELKPVMTLAGNFTMDDGAKAIVKIVDSKESVSAVFFHNDHMAIGALEKCHQLGVDIPDDFSFIGYDDLLASRHSFPPLTTVHQPIKKIGQAAAQIICGMLDENASTRELPDAQTIFRPVLVERDTVKKMGVSTIKPRITQREIECLQWASIGKTAWEISMILGISERTVGFHLSNAATKLQANNRTHAVSIALKKGLING